MGYYFECLKLTMKKLKTINVTVGSNYVKLSRARFIVGRLRRA
jgi:hypothetical protein